MADDFSMQFITGGDSSAFSKTPYQAPKGFMSDSGDEFDDNTPPPPLPEAASTPGSRKRKAKDDTAATSTPNQKKAKGAAPRKSVAFAETASPDPLSVLPTRQKQTRKAKHKAAQSRPIARSYDECDEADQILLDWRDEGKEWKDIRAEWKRLTGEAAAVSTLPNRYARLKSNFTVIKEEDNARLILAKREVEDSFEAQKWDLVVKVVQEKGGDEYPPIALRRQYKKLMVGAGAQVPAGIEDKDFMIPELGSEDERLGREDEELDFDREREEDGDEDEE